MNRDIVLDTLLKMCEIDLDLLANDIQRLKAVEDFLFAGESFVFTSICFYNELHEIQFNQYADSFGIEINDLVEDETMSKMLEALLKEEIENDKK